MRRRCAALTLLLALFPAHAAEPPAGPSREDSALARASETVTREVLANGGRLIVQSRPGCGTFAAELLSEGGTVRDDASLHGLSTVLARALLSGTRSRTMAQQALEVERTGATVQPVSGPAALGLRASGPAPAFHAVLDVMVDAARAPLLAPDDVAREVALERQSLRASLDDPATAMERALRPAVYGDHPLGRVADVERHLDGVDAGVLAAAHAVRFTGSRLVLVIVGDVPHEAALRRGREALEAFPAGAPPEPLAPPAMLSEEKRAHARRRTTQPLLFVGVPTAGLAPDEWPAMELLTEILAGFQERIYTEIREMRGWAYWVRAEDRRYREAGLFGITTAVPHRRLADAETIVRRELERIAAEPPSPGETDRARRILLTGLAREWQRSAARASSFAWRETRGLAPATFAEQEASLRAVQSAGVSALARRLLSASKPAIVTLR